MGLFQAIGRAYREFRSSLENPQSPLSYPAEWLLDIFNGGRTDSGIRVSEMTALQVVDVYACVRLISSIKGSLDVHVYERLFSANGRAGKRIAFDHDLYDLLSTEPNPEMTSVVFRQTLQAHALLWSNSYAEIQRDPAYRIVALWPRNPARCHPRRASQKILVGTDYILPGELYYTTTEGTETSELNPEAPEEPQRPERCIVKENMLHVPGLTLDGRLGQSTVWLARQAIGLALALEKNGAKLFGNGSRPDGILTYPGKLKDADREMMKKSWREAHGGENANSVSVLEQGMTWTPTSFNPNDAQATQSREFQRAQVCAIFGVNPALIGDTSKVNRSNAEQTGIDFVNYTMDPWLKKDEQEYKRKLFPKVGRNAAKFFAMFDRSPLLMPDAASRKAFNDSGKQWGWLSTNDIREREHLNPVDDPDADALWMPVNMQRMGADAPDDTLPMSDSSARAVSGYVKVYSRLFRAAFDRAVDSFSPDTATFRRFFQPLFEALADDFRSMVSKEMAIEFEGSAVQSRFLLDYIDGMRRRLTDWQSANGNSNTVAQRELQRAVKAILIDTYREAATARAKVLTEAEA